MNAALDQDKEKLMRSYLLGELSETERTRFEERFLGDDDQFAELLAVEENLIDRYLSGSLSASELRNFEKTFLASPRRRRIVETQSLLRTSAEIRLAELKRTKEAPQTSSSNTRPSRFFRYPAARWAVAGVALLIVIGGSWLIWRFLETPKRIEQVAVNSERNAPEPPADILPLQPAGSPTAVTNKPATDANRTNVLKPANDRRAPRAGSAVATLLLSPGLTRGGGEPPILTLSRATRTVIVKVPLAGDAGQTYQVAVQTPEGKEIWNASGLRAIKGSSLSVSIPARSFTNGDYILTVNRSAASGTLEKVGQYAFSSILK